jgi:hypothetical protein
LVVFVPICEATKLANEVQRLAAEAELARTVLPMAWKSLPNLQMPASNNAISFGAHESAQRAASKRMSTAGAPKDAREWHEPSGETLRSGDSSMSMLHDATDAAREGPSKQ